MTSPESTPGAVREVLDADDVQRALTRIAHEILERNKGADDLVLLGIPTRGVPLARRLAERIAAVEGAPVPVGSLDITMYRDDLRLRPARALEPHRDPARRHRRQGRRPRRRRAVLRPDRPGRARRPRATSAGPRSVQLAVLVDRGHRELPIRADYVGKNLPTSLRETVRVLLAEQRRPRRRAARRDATGGAQ